MTSSVSTQTEQTTGSALLSMYALVTVTGGMASMAGYSPVWLSLAVLACAAHGILADPEKPWALPDTAADILCALAFLLGLSEYYLLGLALTICMAHFLTIVAMVVLFRRKDESHYRLMRLTLIVVTAIAATTAETWMFLLSFFGAACVLIWNHMVCDDSLPAGAEAENTDGLSLVRGSVAVGAAVLFCAWLVYLTYPRVSALELGGRRTQQQDQETQTSIGFTESVSPGQIDTPAGGNELVMEVQFSVSGQGSSALQPPILMRGQVMGTYANGSWQKYRSRPSRGRRFYRSFSLNAVPGLPRSRYVLEDIPHRPRRVLQRIRLRTSDTRVLFCLARPVWASVDGGSEVGFDPVTHVLYTGTGRAGPRTYRVFSLRPQVPNSRLAGATPLPPEDVEGPFLQIPDRLEPRLEQTLEIIRRNYDTDSAYALVQAVTRYLRDSGEFDYTLVQPEMAGMDPIEAFLEQTRSGSCTHFASAMALLLRSQDIPARLVVGFRGGEESDNEMTREFYQRHAHAWVEVAFEEYGWLPFDPTPGGLADGDSLSSAFARLKRMLTGPRGTWFYIFVGYGKQHQRQILAALGDLASAAFQEVGEAAGQVTGIDGGGAGSAGLVVAALVFLVLAAWALRRLLRLSDSGREVPVEFYRRVISVLQEHGLHRPSHLTAREFAERTVDRLHEDESLSPRFEEALRRLTDLYYEVRYGARSLSPREQDEVERLLAVVAETVQHPDS